MQWVLLVISVVAVALLVRERMANRRSMREVEQLRVRDSSHTVVGNDETVFDGKLVDITTEQRVNVELARRAEQQQALAEIARKALRDADVGNVLRMAAEKACALLDAECLVISQMQEDHGLITTSATYQVDSVRDREMLLDYVRGRMTVVPEGDLPSSLESSSIDGVTVSGTQISLAARTDVFGAISVAGRGFEPSSQDLDFLAATAATLGSALSRARARAQMAQLMRSKDQFVATVSHELRTPLTVVAGLALELEAGWRRFPPEEQAEFISLIADQSREMGNLIEDLLVAARADTSHLAIFPQRVDIRTCIDQVVSACSKDDRQRIEVTGDHVQVFVDSMRCRQVLRNLLTNAIKYGGSRIRVSAEVLGGNALLTVFDDGDGVAEGDRDRIFAAYERAQSPSGAVPGSVGLGLTVSQQLTERMGGSISYRYAGGSFFEIRLPLADEPLQPADLVGDSLQQVLE